MATRHDTRRRFEQWVQNPDCEANTISAVSGVRMDEVAKAEKLETSMGQSPFALARGTTFERGLLADDGKRLIEALTEDGVLPGGASGLLDLRLRMNGGPVKDLDAANEATRKVLGDAATKGAAGAGKLPAVISAATLQVPGQPVMLPEGKVAIDALVLRPSDDGQLIELVIGEIKTYPDRAGYTDAGDLATARAQAGVYLHALRLVVEELGLADELVISSDGFLVLTKSGRNEPSVRSGEDLEFQARRAARGFERLRAAAKLLEPFNPEDTEKGIKEVQRGDTAYRPSCLGFCDRAPGCRKAAEVAGDGRVLGDDVKRFLGDTSLSRALELLDGGKPTTSAERDLASRMQEAGAK